MNMDVLAKIPTAGLAGNNPRICDFMNRAVQPLRHTPRTASAAPALGPFLLGKKPAG